MALGKSSTFPTSLSPLFVCGKMGAAHSFDWESTRQGELVDGKVIWLDVQRQSDRLNCVDQAEFNVEESDVYNHPFRGLASSKEERIQVAAFAEGWKPSCIGRESNPGLPRGRRESYHWTTNACVKAYFYPWNFFVGQHLHLHLIVAIKGGTINVCTLPPWICRNSLNPCQDGRAV